MFRTAIISIRHWFSPVISNISVVADHFQLPVLFNTQVIFVCF